MHDDAGCPHTCQGCRNGLHLDCSRPWLDALLLVGASEGGDLWQHWPPVWLCGC